MTTVYRRMKMSKINSRAKGCVGERELASELRRVFGWNAVRAQQHSGNAGDADVTIPEMPKLFAEVKRVQKLNVQQAMDKAAEQAAVAGKSPILFHRRNNKQWLVTLKLGDLSDVVSMVTLQQQSDCSKTQSKSCEKDEATTETQPSTSPEQ